MYLIICTYIFYRVLLAWTHCSGEQRKLFNCRPLHTCASNEWCTLRTLDCKTLLLVHIFHLSTDNFVQGVHTEWHRNTVGYCVTEKWKIYAGNLQVRASWPPCQLHILAGICIVSWIVTHCILPLCCAHAHHWTGILMPCILTSLSWMHCVASNILDKGYDQLTPPTAYFVPKFCTV